MATQPVGKSGQAAACLTADAQHLVDRLAEISTRIVKLCITLHGAEPRDASSEKPEPPSSMRRSIDKAHTIAAQIESELTSIENRL